MLQQAKSCYVLTCSLKKNSLLADNTTKRMAFILSCGGHLYTVLAAPHHLLTVCRD